ncbi:MAG: hypothetical protein K6E97_04975 [Treponema sp.]|nr:hypothetical protein [Treponema sp.]
MIISRIILDGLAMSLFFNFGVGMFSFILPQAYSTMFPKEIKEAAAPYVVKKDVKKMYTIILSIYAAVFLYFGISTYFSGVKGFWNLFWTGYIEMLFVNFGDLLILDCLLRAVTKNKKDLIKGAENCKAWNLGEWMKAALPEHLLIWPVTFCPIAGLITAGIVKLLSHLG